MYGLVTARILPQHFQRLDSFHLRGLRQILGIKTSFGQLKAGQTRTNTNSYVVAEANRIVSLPPDPKPKNWQPPKPVTLVSELVHAQQTHFLGHLIREREREREIHNISVLQPESCLRKGMRCSPNSTLKIE